MSRITRWYRAVLTNDRVHRIKRLGRRALQSYIFLIILGVIVGLQVAPVVSNVASGPTGGTVAVIPIHGGITGASAATAVAQLERARNDPSIDAVVLHIDSSGGGAAPSQEVYLEVVKTAEQMPVVALADAVALSGGYHIAVGSDEIIVKPGTLIGNVGVVLTLPQDVAPLDSVITTGPDKLTGSTSRGWYYKSETIKRSFVSAVVTNRGDRLTLSPEEVAHGTIYTGSEAVSNGIADRYGTTLDAIDRAASRAGLGAYDVTVMEFGGTVRFLTHSAFVASNAPEKEMVSPTYFTGTPGEVLTPTIVMIPPSVVRTAETPGDMASIDTAEEVTTNDTVAA